MNLEIERQALQKEEDRESQERLAAIESQLESLRGEAAILREKWRREKSLIDEVKRLKEEIEGLRNEQDTLARRGDLSAAAEIRFGRLVQAQRSLEVATARLEEERGDNSLSLGEVTEEDIAPVSYTHLTLPTKRIV